MQTLSTEQLVGQTIDNYVVRSLLGRSRLNAVYLAQHPMQQEVVALTTFCLPEHFSSEARARFQQRFVHEAAALTTLKHRNLLPVIGYGEKFGYSYLITPYMTNGSLADLLQHQGYYAPSYALHILEQIAAGVGYAHRKGMVHGTLKLSNILFQSNETFVVAGFGLSSILQQRGIKPIDKPYAHLLNVADTFLYAPTSIAPEVVQGQPVDFRSDIYGIGAMLFELLSGQPLFTGSSPLDIAMQHVQSPLPSLHHIRSDIPIAMELVVNHALARDPNQRFQHVGEFVEAFAQTCRGEVSHANPHHNRSSTSSMLNASGKGAAVNESLAHMREENTSTGPWQFLPPVVTGKINAVSVTGKQTNTPLLSASAPGTSVEPKPIVQQEATNAPVQPGTQRFPTQRMPPESVTKDTDPMKTPDWWIQAPSDPFAAYLTKQSEQSQNVSNTKALHAKQSGSLSATQSTKRSRRSTKRSHNAGRRKVVALLAGGSVAAVGVGVAVKMNLIHLIPSTAAPMSSIGSTTTTNGNQSQMGNMGGMRGMNGMGNGGTPTQNTSQGHAGTVVGTKDLGINESMGFLNPSDGKPSLLIHLPNGKFVAYERACTHQGVSVNYDPVTHKLVCPAHGAIFDPSNSAAVLQGPATRPLALVTVRVNADGTITV